MLTHRGTQPLETSRLILRRAELAGAVMRKCGMHFEGVLRQAGRNNQGVCDEAFYSLLREEWQANER